MMLLLIVPLLPLFVLMVVPNGIPPFNPLPFAFPEPLPLPKPVETADPLTDPAASPPGDVVPPAPDTVGKVELLGAVEFDPFPISGVTIVEFEAPEPMLSVPFPPRLPVVVELFGSVVAVVFADPPAESAAEASAAAWVFAARISKQSGMMGTGT